MMAYKSMFLEHNNTQGKFTDENGKPLEGVRIGEDKQTILRFRNGWLDGDIIGENGNLITVKPAVERQGHLEYWRKNKLHRDDNLPAVISDDFTHKEYWENGVNVG